MEMTETEKEDNDKWSGTIVLEKDDIVFKWQNIDQKRFSLNDIKVIGEMTSQADPIAIDWYIVFVDKNNEQYYVPAYANEMQNFLKQLGNRLEIEFIGTLYSSIDFASNVIYPKELAGKKFLEFKDDEPKNFWEKIGKFLGFGKPIVAELTKEIKEYKNGS
jgi:hypothetical protein